MVQLSASQILLDLQEALYLHLPIHHAVFVDLMATGMYCLSTDAVVGMEMAVVVLMRAGATGQGRCRAVEMGVTAMQGRMTCL